MANENRHSGKKTHITTVSPKLVMYRMDLLTHIAFLICSAGLIYFALRRGTPIYMLALYALGTIINLVGVIFSLANLASAKHGIFKRTTTKREIFIWISWLAVLLAESLLGSYLFRALRIDLFVILGLNVVAVIFTVGVKKGVNYRVNGMQLNKAIDPNKKSKKKNSIRRKKSRIKNLSYVSILIWVVALEGACLFVPKYVPPMVDDIFSEYRAVQYESYTSEYNGQEGYIVTGLYLGTSTKVLIPETYNGKPVFAIDTKGLYDSKITEVYFGTYNAETKEYVSKIEYLKADSIILNSVSNVTIPASVKKMETNAIQGNNIEMITYYGTAPIDCAELPPSTRVLNVQSSEVVSIKFDDKMSNLEIKVPDDNYNDYREQNYDCRNMFYSDDNSKVVVNFENQGNYYLQSLIIERDSSGYATLKLQDFVNTGEISGAYQLDSENYYNDKSSSSGFVSNLGYAFRGWYFDPEFTRELDFSKNPEIKITNSTTIYAKWMPIRKVNLEWTGGYLPTREEVSTIEFIDDTNIVGSLNSEKVYTFPAMIKDGEKDYTYNRTGFTSLQWYCPETDSYYVNTADLKNIEGTEVNLVATWTLDTVNFDYATNQIIDGEVQDKGNEIQKTNEYYVFDESQEISFEVLATHLSDDVSITFKLFKDDELVYINSVDRNEGTFNYKLRNHNQSGNYSCVLEAKAKSGETSSISKDYTITIDRKEYQLDVDKFPDPGTITETYNGLTHSFFYDATSIDNCIVHYEYDLDNNDTYESAVGPIHGSEIYKVNVVFKKTGPEEDNYNPGTRLGYLNILPREIWLDWSLNDAAWTKVSTGYYERIYDGLEHQPLPKVVNLLSNDEVELIYEAAGYTEVGNDYVSEVKSELTNKDYVYSADTITQLHWSIKPKKIELKPQLLSQEYESEELKFIIKVDGLCAREYDFMNNDNFEFSLNDFTSVKYDASSKSFILTATNAATYPITFSKLTEKNNVSNNYYFPEGGFSFNFAITKPTLEVEWSKSSYNYSDEETEYSATISGFKGLDNTVELDNLFTINKGEFISYSSKNQGKEIVEVIFKAKDAGEYIASISKCLNENYIFAAQMDKTFTINKAELTTTWSSASYDYDGKDTTYVATIKGFMGNDNQENVDDLFTIDKGKFTAYSYDNKSGITTITFTAKNAGKYIASIANCLDSNYIFEVQMEKAFEINKAVLTTKWEGSSYTYTGNDATLEATISGFMVDDNTVNLEDLFAIEKGTFTTCTRQVINTDTIKIIYTARNAGIYKTSITKCFNTNYVFEEVLDKTLTINKAEFKISWDTNEDVTYDGKITTVTAKIEFPFTDEDYALLSKNDFSCTAYGIEGYELGRINKYPTLVFSVKNAKEYSLKIDTFINADLNGNIVLSSVEGSSKARIFTVNPRSVVIEWSKISGFTYDTEKHSVEASITNVIPGDTVLLTTIENEKKDAGDYTAEVTALSNSNYTLEACKTSSYEWSIHQKAITIAKTTEDYIYDGKYKQITLAISNIYPDDLKNVIKDDFTISKSSEDIIYVSSGESDGKYIYQFKVLNANTYTLAVYNNLTNYSYKTESMSTKVAKRGVEIEWVYPGGYVYNSTTYSVRASATNAVISEETGISDVITFEYKNADKVNANTYTAEVISCLNDNYILDSSINYKLNWEIEARTIAYTWSSSSFVYNSFDQAPIIVPSNICDGDSIRAEYSVLSNQKVVSEYSTVGTYSCKLVELNNPNYKLPENSIISCNYLITTKKLSYSATSTNSYVYNGNVINGKTITITGFVNAEDATKFADGKKLANSYTSLSLTNANPSIEYIADGETVYVYFKASLANTYSIETTGSSDSNYLLSSTSLSFTITPKPITIDWTGDYEYCSSDLTSYCYATNMIAGDEINYTYTYTGTSYAGTPMTSATVKEAGEYKMVLESIDNPNYTISSLTLAQRTHNFAVTRRPLSVTWSTNSDVEYNGQWQDKTATISNFAGNDSAQLTEADFEFNSNTYKKKFEISATKNVVFTFSDSDVGTYNFGITNTVLANYSLALSASSLTISKAALQIVWDYDGAYTYDGKLHSVTPSFVTYTNVKSGAKDNIDYTTGGTFSDIAADTYTAKILTINSDFYQLPSDTSKTQKVWKIMPRTLTFALVADSVTYDGKYHYASVEVEGIAESDVATFDFANITATTKIHTNTNSSIEGIISRGTNSVIGRFRYIDAGTVSYYPTAISDTNYTFVSRSYSQIIEKKSLTITWPSSSQTLFTYNGTAQGIVPTLNGICANEETSSIDDVSYTSSLTNKLSQVNAGTYFAEVAGITGDKSYNYSILTSVKLCSYIISPMKLTTNWINTEDSIYSGETQKVTLRLTGFLEQDDLSAYSTASALKHNSSYTVNLVKDLDSLSMDLVFSHTNANTYTYSVRGFTSTGNYTFDTAEASKLIAKKELTYTLHNNDETYTYDAKEHKAYVTFDNVCAVDSSTIKFNTSTGSLTSSQVGSTVTLAQTSANAYKLNITGCSSSNYAFTPITLLLTINQRVLSYDVVGDDESYVYDATSHSASIVIKNVCAEDEDSIKFKTVKNNASSTYIGLTHTVSGTNQGDYNLEVSLDNSNPAANYTFAGATVSFAITKRPINFVITGNNGIYTYDGESHSLSVKANNICASDVAALRFVTSDDNQKTVNMTIDGINAGKYTFNITGVNNSNYSIATQSLGFTIKKRVLTLTATTPVNGVYTNTNYTASIRIDNFIKDDAASVSYYDITKEYDTTTGGAPEMTSSYDETTGMDYITMTFSRKNAGSSTFSITGIAPSTAGSISGNYEIVTPATASITVEKATLSIVGPSSKECTFTNATQSIAVEVSGYLNDGTISSSDWERTATFGSSMSFSLGTITYSAISAKDYTLTISSLNTKNYTLAKEAEIHLNIKPKVVSITVDEDLDTVYDGTAHAVTATVNGLYTNIESSYFTFGAGTPLSYNASTKVFTLSQTNAGEYHAFIEGITNSNYVLDSTYSMNLTIQKKVVSAEDTDSTVTYNAKAQTVSVKVNGILDADLSRLTKSSFRTTNGSNLTFENGTFKLTKTIVGSYESIVESLDDTNYVLEKEFTIRLVIEPKILSVTPDVQTTCTYDGTQRDISITISGFLTTPTASAVKYTASAPVGISISSSYGLNIMTLTMHCTDVGTYTLSVDSSALSSYTLVAKSTTLTINPIELNITGTSSEMEESGNLLSYEFAVENFLGNSSITSDMYTISEGATITSTTTNGVNKTTVSASVPGTYTVTFKSGTYGNYKITTEKVITLTITAKAVDSEPVEE